MKICGISDTHGLHRQLNIEECEILCIAGDISPLSIQGRIAPMLKWLEEDFIPWCESLPVKKVLFVPGNHDFVCYHKETKVRHLFENTKIVYLQDELFEYKFEDRVYKFWGTPWCTIFGNWAYMKLPEIEYEKFMLIPSDIDVVITHNPPYGACDICIDHPYGNYNNLGNLELSKVIEIKHPKIVLCGHLHTGSHWEENLDTTRIFNVSVVNEQYQIYYKPLYLNL